MAVRVTSVNCMQISLTTLDKTAASVRRTGGGGEGGRVEGGKIKTGTFRGINTGVINVQLRRAVHRSLQSFTRVCTRAKTRARRSPVSR